MNIAKLNTASLDDKTFIIKRGTSGGTTINNQDKVVDITENGTTEVVADGGYTGLGKVTINTEVSGGGGGNLSPDAIVYEPNGWYWRAKEGTYNFSDYYQILSVLSLSAYSGVVASVYGEYEPKDMVGLIKKGVELGMDVRRMQYNTQGLAVVAFAESKNAIFKMGTNIVSGSSLYEVFTKIEPMTEDKFLSMFEAEYGFIRITKEEYEALTTE